MESFPGQQSCSFITKENLYHQHYFFFFFFKLNHESRNTLGRRDTTAVVFSGQDSKTQSLERVKHHLAIYP